MIDHLSIGVADIDRAVAFYDRALYALGHVRLWRQTNAAGYGEPGGEDVLALFEATGAGDKSGFHLALTAADEDAVRRFHREAISAGGTDAGAPGLRPQYAAHYYAAFVLDPDGTKLEAVFHG